MAERTTEPATPRWERLGIWRIWSRDPDAMPARIWIDTVDRLATSGDSLHRSKHADTYRWSRPGGDVYVKIYRRYRRWTALKDWFRPSKAENVRRVSAQLAAYGFAVPRVLAVGEERPGIGVRRSWSATAGLGGEPVAARLAALGGAGDRTTLRAKRGLLAALGREVARLHRTGVVAGDLVPANVWIAIDDAELRIAFLDHDRTRATARPVSWRRARRNLVQLNRIVLAGVSTTDRLRVYRAYAGAEERLSSVARARVGWIVAKTIARRRAERGHTVPIPPNADFRAVMRAGGPYTYAPAEERRS